MSIDRALLKQRESEGGFHMGTVPGESWRNNGNSAR